jgi:uncharacterized protein (TIGR00290 family)
MATLKRGVMKNLWLSWSSGKDSTYCLHKLQVDPDIKITGLVTTVTKDFDRVSMHAVRTTLLKKQAEALSLPLHIVEIPATCTNEIYEEEMTKLLRKAEKENVSFMAFGDLFLEDVRDYRIKKLSTTTIQPVFPIWGIPTKLLAPEIIDSGIKAYITCVDPKKLPKEFVGRAYDKDFLRDLPKSVDPCGENGEFHSFVYDSPYFKAPISVKCGEITERDSFVFCDIIETTENFNEAAPSHLGANP